MILNKTDRVEFRRRVNILIPQNGKIKNCEGSPIQTFYDTINRMQLGGAFNGKKKAGRPTS